MILNPVLSIAIPTYNRSVFLSRCLESIINQAENLSLNIELIVSDNASTDDTSLIVSNYQKRFPIRYFLNEVNKGPDFNIASCFEKSEGKYVWVFGDDDFLLPNALSKIIKLLESNEFGVLHIAGTAVNDNLAENHSKNIDDLDFKIYDDFISFMNRISFYATFITGNIVNKSALPNDFSYHEFLGTYLIQVSWIILASHVSKRNAVIGTPLVACEQDNSGGYNYIKVFSKNYNSILESLVRRGIDSEVISITNKSILHNHLPIYIYNLLYKKNSFVKDDGFYMLLRCYWPYYKFWKNILPIYLKFWIKSNIGMVSS